MVFPVVVPAPVTVEAVAGSAEQPLSEDVTGNNWRKVEQSPPVFDDESATLQEINEHFS